MRRWLVVLVLAVIAAGCGGGSDDGDGGSSDDGGGTAATTTQAPSSDAGAVETTVPPQDNGDRDVDGVEGSGPSTATLTLGDQTYQFSSEGAVAAQCLTDLFGIFSVQLPAADGGDGSISIIALHPGTDPDEIGEVNSVRVDVGDDTWIANEGDEMFETSDKLVPGMGQVDSVEIDGSTVRGTATFFRQLSVLMDGDVETVTGTFEATCGEERTS